jgi:hypothetical protein
MNPLIIKQARRRLVLLALFFLCLAITSGFILYTINNTSGIDLFSCLVLSVNVLLFGIVSALSLKQAFSKKPHMLLNEEGIFDYNLKMGVLPWSEITGAHIRQMLNQKNVQLELRDPEKCRKSQPWPLRLLSAYSLAMGTSPFVLYTSYTNISADIVVNYIFQQVQSHSSATCLANNLVAKGN